MSKNLSVVVLQLVGLGVVVVLGPFRDKITSCQFHLSSVWGLAKASMQRKITRIKSFMVIFSFSLLLMTLKVKVETRWELVPELLHPRTPTSTYASWPVSRDFQAFVLWKWEWVGSQKCRTRQNIFIWLVSTWLLNSKILLQHTKKRNFTKSRI